MTKSYVHTPLNGNFSTRVLLLEPAAAPDEALRCSLVEIPLDSKSNYTALSYSWDSQSPTCAVKCGEGSLSVTPNCWAALRRLRNPCRVRELWIDSICIDQTSLHERSQQVALMDEIYKRAQSVIVWLGEGDGRVETAMKKLRDIGYLNTKQPESEEEKVTAQETLTLVHDVGKESAKGILDPTFELSWFYRMWTVQEVTLPAVENIEVQYGSISFPWLLFLLAMNLLKIAKFKWSNWYQATLLQRRITSMFIEKRDPSWAGILDVDLSNTLCYRNLLRLFASMRPKKSTDPKDKVFALYGVAKELGFDLPLPDYAKSLERIYIDAAVACVQIDNNVSILYESPSAKRLAGLPSWVPDWSDEQATSSYCRAYTEREFKAGGNVQSRFSFSDDHRQLKISGMLIDSVTAWGTILHFGETDLDGREMIRKGTRPSEGLNQLLHPTVDVLKDWVGMTRPTGSYPTGGTENEALRRCILEAGPDYLGDRPNDTSWKAWFAFMRRTALADDSQASGLRTRPTTSSVPLSTFFSLATSVDGTSPWEVHNVVLRKAAGKCFFRTGEGYFGMATMPVKYGDQVALLQGFEVPFILRQGHGGYSVIAYGHVHGIMHGELWREESKVEITLV